MKVIPVFAFLLLLQPAFSQYKWSDLDKKLEDNQKLLGNNVVCLLWKGDSLIYKKEMVGLIQRLRPQLPVAANGLPLHWLCSSWMKENYHWMIK